MAEPPSSATAPHRKSKKRSRQESSDAEPAEPVTKKKKNKKDRSDVPPSPPIETVTVTPTSKEDKRDKSKKKKAKRDGDHTPSNGTPATAQPVDNDAATSAAFLSALVTAAAPGLHDQSAYTPMIDPFAQYSAGQFSLSSQYIPMPMLQPPPLPGAPFSDLSFGSNDDILRTFQDLDVTKLASALRNLGEGTTISGMDLSGMDLSGLEASQPTGQLRRPAKSTTKTVQTERQQGKKKHTRTLDMGLLPPESSSTSTSHDELLATKWLPVKKLNELAESEGLIYKKGKFSAIEAQQIKEAVENYARNNSMTVEQVRDELIHSSERRKDQKFFSEMAAAVPLRPVIAVYHYIRRAYHPNQKMGDWTSEQDSALKDAVIRLGPKWEKVAPEVGRAASDCRDRYRNHIHHRDRRKSGAWTKAEEEELVKIITSLTNKEVKDLKAEGEIFWVAVSEKMQGTRSPQQCRIKWLDSLMNRLRNEGENSRWSSQDAFILVHKVDSLGVRDDSEIDWKRLPDPDWNAWSAHVLQRRWLTLKRAVKGYEDMTHQEIMDILRTKFAQLPSSPPKSKRKVVSTLTIDEDEATSEEMSEASATMTTKYGSKSKAQKAPVAPSESSDDSSSDSDSDESD